MGRKLVENAVADSAIRLAEIPVLDTEFDPYEEDDVIHASSTWSWNHDNTHYLGERL